MKKILLPCLLAAAGLLNASGQEREEMLNCGDMDRWLTRDVKESLVIGGNHKILHEVGPEKVIEGDEPLIFNASSPWRTSNVMAKVSGVTKGSTSVFPEVRGHGKCVRMETLVERVKVLGLINISVLAGGSIYLGGVDEPIKGTKNPLGKLIMGVPFTKRPAALRFDYKTKLTGEPDRKKITGFGRQETVAGPDYPEVYMVLQKRWEDADGNVYAKRVATAIRRFTKTQPDWVNDYTVKLEYGDISGKKNLADIEQLKNDDPYYTRNSRGEMVPIREIGWAASDETPTHVVLRFSSSHGGAYIGSPGNKFWIDNVRFVYE